MVSKLIVNVDVPGVGTSDSSVSVPITNWSVLTRFTINNANAILSIPTLGIVGIPAPLLAAIPFNFPLAPLSNLDFLVHVTSGTADITGYIVGMENT